MSCVPCSSGTSSAFQKISDAIEVADQLLALPFGIVALSAHAAARGGRDAASACAVGARKVASFVERNWKPLLAYIFAWGIIISCTGMLYGFQAVALPLTIGLGVGVGFGLVFGLTVGLSTQNDKHTPWNYLNMAINALDENGTRQIVLSVAVTVVLAASVVFPYALGGIFGLFIAWQVAIKIVAGKDLGGDKPEVDHKTLEAHIQQLEARLRALETNGTSTQN